MQTISAKKIAAMPAYLQAIIAGKVTLAPVRTDDVALAPAKAVPAVSPLKTRTASRVQDAIDGSDPIECFDADTVYASAFDDVDDSAAFASFSLGGFDM